ncbi:MAG TPA: chromosome segregation protein SMC [Rhizomicrobium sp.]|nr:chromosome segregation protein SMC [Rhizomicrobium sp.]
MKFNRLRISGFKSFVEPIELFIEPGLTAIVGPNGCGKSNLFDALRWVMGETRPTSIRGTEMDDVIFAGSAGRPARNTAEVILYIDNEDRSASGAYNEFDSIEISRRIEREAGSVYRINGRDVRQRDVQLFFADAASGAASTAFVRQGQIGVLVSQKPLARRAILEEAAGIAGLHQRRHEAELRLRAAEANMARIDDVIAELEGQLASLKRQARQAARYRNLSGLIRKAEALALHLRWTAAVDQGHEAGEALDAAVVAVEALTAVAAQASTLQAEVASELPALRQNEAEAGAALHRLIVERDTLEAEEARAREAAQRLRQRVQQSEKDKERETLLDADALAALTRLEEEVRVLDENSARESHELESAEAHAGGLNDALLAAERRLEAFTAAQAEWHAKKQSHERAISVASALAETSVEQRAAADARLNEAMAGAAEAPDVLAAEMQAERTGTLAQEARAARAQAQSGLDNAAAAESDAREPFDAAERRAQILSAEVKALAELLRPQGPDLWPPLIDSVKVEPGFEAAFAAALGDDLEAPLDEAAPRHWRELDAQELEHLPAGAEPLSKHVDAPQALARRLAMCGIVGEESGKTLQPSLKPGQRLVTMRGGLWRWDGYAASSDVPSPAAVRLAQRNRLVVLEAELAAAREDRNSFGERHNAAKSQLESARESLRVAELEARNAEQALIAAQEHTAMVARAAAERMSKLASLEAEIRRLGQAEQAAREAIAQAETTLHELGDGTAIAEQAGSARNEASDARAAAAEARVALENLRRETRVREQRRLAIGEDAARWQARRDAASQQISELDRRLEEMRSELAGLDEVPARMVEKRQALLDVIAIAETKRKAAADSRADAELRLAQADKAAKEATANLSGAREERARAQALAEGAVERLNELKARIHDELDATPEELPARAEIREGEELPSLEHAEKRAEKLKVEREQLGGVNLRAEEEAAEHQERLNKTLTDRADLDGAIQRLRRGIQSLNREGRERLIESFDKVNANFQQLFTRLFQGGEARLTFTESDDPLEAGLEIFARPPGKKLQSLSLLSGGEQALTALALIFAVFLVNPAPVCVLDEVDAPLDDANVERFCNLLDEMTRLTATRFLVITHHALTMSRMNRLVGVTMAERGVSQLVSVTLAQAEQVVAAE